MFAVHRDMDNGERRFKYSRHAAEEKHSEYYSSQKTLQYIGYTCIVNNTLYNNSFCYYFYYVNLLCNLSIANVGQIVPASVCFGLGYISCTNWIMGVLLLIVGVSFIGCSEGAGFLVNHMDIAPRHAGILMGIANTVASISGVISPYIVGLITTNVSIYNNVLNVRNRYRYSAIIAFK